MLDATRGEQFAATGTLRTPLASFSRPTHAIPGLRAEWRRLARLIRTPMFELTSESVMPPLTCHFRLKAAGAKVDFMADAICQQLAMQVVSREAFGEG